jgi:hypothetical protein
MGTPEGLQKSIFSISKTKKKEKLIWDTKYTFLKAFRLNPKS